MKRLFAQVRLSSKENWAVPDANAKQPRRPATPVNCNLPPPVKLEPVDSPVPKPTRKRGRSPTRTEPTPPFTSSRVVRPRMRLSGDTLCPSRESSPGGVPKGADVKEEKVEDGDTTLVGEAQDRGDEDNKEDVEEVRAQAD